MTVEQWDAQIGEIADTTEFILAEKFECADGQMLGRVLATAGWPRHNTDRMYAKAGDDSNHALRRLQRKYHAALKLLEDMHA